MTPIDFILFNGDSNPNQPTWEVAAAMRKPIIITDGILEFDVLSYYFTEDGMVLEIVRAPADTYDYHDYPED